MMTLRDDARWLIDQVDEAKRLARALGKPQLGTSSIEGGKIEEYDQVGTLAQIIGEQHDGTHTAATVSGPTPPEPVPASVTVGIESAEIRWNGKFADEAMSPMDLSHVAAHASRLEVFSPDNTTQKATITGESGDLATVLLEPGAWTIGLVAVSKAGKWSEMSETVTVEIPDYAHLDVLTDDLIDMGQAAAGKITVAAYAPTLADGEGKPDGALWNQLNETGEQVAVWLWNGTDWVDVPISETFLPLVNIAQGTYGLLDGVQLKGNAIDGMVITGALFQTSDQPEVGMKMDSDGLRAYGPDGGEPVASIRPDGGTTYQVSDPATGEVLGGVDSAGGLAGTSLSVSEETRMDGPVVMGGDPLTSGHGSGLYGATMNGRDLIGATFTNYVDEHPGMSEGNAWLTAVPHGVINNSWHEHGSPWYWSGRGGQDHVRVHMTTTTNFVSGRMYQISYRAPAIKQTGTLTTGHIGAAHVKYSDPNGSVSAATGWSLRGTRQYLAAGGSMTTASMTTVARCPEDIPAGKVMMGIEVYVYEGYTAESSSTPDANRFELSVIDFGARRPLNDGKLSNLVSWGPETGTGDPVADPPPAPDPDPIKQYTDTVSATWWQAYVGGGEQATGSVYSGSAAQGRTPYYTANGVMRGLIGIPSQESRLSGSTVKKIEVYVYAKSWHFADGGTACIGVHSNTGKPSTWSSTTNNVKQQKMKRAEGRWITLPSSVHAGFKSGDLRGISFLPPSSSTSTEYYGIFTGSKTKFRFTYTK